MNNDFNFNDLLKSNDLKVTKHRLSVLGIIAQSNYPLTAEEIYLKLKSKSILGDDNKTSYEITSSEHMHHLICKQCKGVFPLTDCPLCIYEKHLKEDMDFDVTDHKLEVYGYCKKCKTKPKD